MKWAALLAVLAETSTSLYPLSRRSCRPMMSEPLARKGWGMGFRARRSIKVAKGVRLNVSKGGVGVSVGGRGARYSVHSSGRRTTSVGIPGTGVSHVSTKTSGSRAKGRSGAGKPRPASVPAAAPVKPGLFAPKGEKALYKAVKGALNLVELDGIAREHPDFWLASSTLAGLKRAGIEGEEQAARQQLAHVFTYQTAPERDQFLTKYLSAASVRVGIAPGVDVELPLTRELVGLTLAELHQAAGDLDAAIDVVEQLEPTAHAAVSLAELYVEAGRHDDVVDLTNGLANEDDVTALLATYRGVALRELGHFEASREALKEALKSKKRDAQIRHRALFERAETYEREGKRAQAKKDLERIMAEDAAYPSVRERLAELGAG